MDTTTSPKRTGPHTPEGRAAVRQNGIRHGLSARSIVIDGVESESDWDEFQTDIIDALAPATSIEVALATRVAELVWRLRRVPRAERDLIAAAQDRDDAVAVRRVRIEAIEEEERRFVSGHMATDPTTENREPATDRRPSFYASALVPLEVPPPPPDRRRLLPEDVGLDRIIRYEAHLNRQLANTLHELEALQWRRQGRASPLARLDVHLTGDE